MNNDAHGVLASAIANHGEKIATSDAYCKVYLSGYMADYPVEKQLLISLRQLALPDALIAFRASELSESDVYEFIKTLGLNESYRQSDIAWGVDAWAFALSLPESMRKAIDEGCFATSATQFMAGESPKHTVQDEFEHSDFGAVNAGTQDSRRGLVRSIAAMVLFGLTTTHFADGSVPVKTAKAPIPKLVTLKSPVKNERAVYVKKTGHPLTHKVSKLSLAKVNVKLSVDAKPVKPVKPVKPAKPVKMATIKVVNNIEPRPYEVSGNKNTVVKIQRTQRLNADIEAFLKQEH